MTKKVEKQLYKANEFAFYVNLLYNNSRFIICYPLVVVFYFNYELEGMPPVL